MLIRDASEIDLPELLSIQKKAFMRYTDHLLPEQIPPLNENIDEVIKDFHDKSILVAETDGKVAGSVRFSIRAGVCFLERLSVGPDLQGIGIGKELVKEVERHAGTHAHKIYLETGLLANNLLIFYTKLGYTGEAILRKHYSGFDWIVFSKFLDNKEVNNVNK